MTKPESNDLLAPGSEVIWYQHRKWGGKQAVPAIFLALTGECTARIRVDGEERTVYRHNLNVFRR